MATRMQQRRGTAAQWTAANPTLAAGEIGFETDTNQFKIGNGSSAWSALSYFKNLDALDGVGGIVTLNSNGVIDINLIPQGVALDAELAQYVEDHNDETENIHGISNTANLVYQVNLTDAISNEVTNRNTAITNAITAEATDRNTAIDDAIAAEVTDRNTAITDAIATEVSNRDQAIDDAITLEVTNRNQAITDAIGDEVTNRNQAIDDAITAEVTDRNDAIGTQIGTHNTDTTGVHGITNTALLATTSDVSAASAAAETYANGAVSTHNGLTANVHGITNTANLVYTNDSRLSDTRTPTDDTVSTAKIVDNAVTSAKIANGTIVNADINASAAIDWTKLAISSSVSGTELGYVGGVTSAIQTQLDAKLASASAASTYAPLASPALTGTPTAPTATAGTNTTQVATTQFVTGAVNDLIASAPGALNTLDELAAALGDDANFATTVTNSLAAKAPLASPTFTGTVTVAASGIAFTDGTQTKEGVPSRTPIIQKSAAYTLSALTERDSMIEVSHTGGTAVDITIPANSSVAYPIGTSIDILRTNTGGVRIVGASGVTVNGTPGVYLRAQWSAATLFKRATDTWVLIGDLATA